MQWVMKKRSYWEFGELLNPGVKTLIYATDPKVALRIEFVENIMRVSLNIYAFLIYKKNKKNRKNDLIYEKILKFCIYICTNQRFSCKNSTKNCRPLQVIV